MTNSAYVRTELAYAGLDLVPPLIRETLLEDSDFRKEYGFAMDAILSFGDPGVSFQCSDFFDAVRKVLSDTPEAEVTDTDDNKWELQNVSEERELPNLVLSHGEQRLTIPDFSVLSPDSATRLRFLERSAPDTNLPNSVRDAWCSILMKRALEDDEVDAFYDELRDTPIQRARLICSEAVDGKGYISSLVPSSSRYFERLVGAYDGSNSIREYATGSARNHFHELSAWRPYAGFLLSLLLSSHPALTAEIDVDQMRSEDLARALDILEKQGDRISQLGAIEVGLRVLPSRPDIEPALIRLIEKVRDDDVDRATSGFQLLSALFTLVDGELSRTRLLSGLPPFYRRLAALSQASLIHRQLVYLGVDVGQFCEWARRCREGQHSLQSLTDMRQEPRWDPTYAAASQIKANFLGRIVIAAKKHEENIKGSRIFDLILTTNPGSLLSFCDLSDPSMYLPSPLEGTVETQNILPAEISEVIEKHLVAKEVESSSFIALINSALLFHVGQDQVNLAAKALKLTNYRLKNVESRSQLIAILNGLATVAAVTRSHTLADELRILVRTYVHDPEYALSLREAIWICLVAAASRADLNDWRDFVGDWLTELAFNDLKGDDGEVLHLNLRYLCHVIPELWVSCGRADAALMAYNANRHSA